MFKDLFNKTVIIMIIIMSFHMVAWLEYTYLYLEVCVYLYVYVSICICTYTATTTKALLL